MTCTFFLYHKLHQYAPFFLNIVITQVSDKHLRQFKESIRVDRSSEAKKSGRQDGSDVVRDELDQINRGYQHMLDWADSRIKHITAIMEEAGHLQVPHSHTP